MNRNLLHLIRGLGCELTDAGHALTRAGSALDRFSAKRLPSPHPAFQSNRQLDGVRSATSGAGVEVRYKR